MIWELHLYTAGQTARSAVALSNLKRICEGHLKGRYIIKVLDLAQHPHLAEADGILATPTLIKRSPLPLTRLIGDLSNTERVLRSLDLEPTPPAG